MPWFWVPDMRLHLFLRLCRIGCLPFGEQTVFAELGAWGWFFLQGTGLKPLKMLSIASLSSLTIFFTYSFFSLRPSLISSHPRGKLTVACFLFALQVYHKIPMFTELQFGWPICMGNRYQLHLPVSDAEHDSIHPHLLHG